MGDQFSQWSEQTITPVRGGGTDNAIFRLGDDLVVRLPKVDWAAGQPVREAHFLGLLASRVTRPLPAPLALGAPGRGYPWNWTVCPWIAGEPATEGAHRLADGLAGFLKDLRAADPVGGPEPGHDNSYRGCALRRRSRATLRDIDALEDEIDSPRARTIWSEALAAPDWSSPPVWIHGDLLPGNLIVKNGELVGLIDFGCLAVADPACDLMAAWTCFGPDDRETFRSILAPSSDDWVRARGWAVSWAVVALAFYRDSNLALAATARRTLAELGVAG